MRIILPAGAQKEADFYFIFFRSSRLNEHHMSSLNVIRSYISLHRLDYWAQVQEKRSAESVSAAELCVLGGMGEGCGGVRDTQSFMENGQGVLFLPERSHTQVFTGVIQRPTTKIDFFFFELQDF